MKYSIPSFSLLLSLVNCFFILHEDFKISYEIGLRLQDVSLHKNENTLFFLCIPFVQAHSKLSV